MNSRRITTDSLSKLHNALSSNFLGLPGSLVDSYYTNQNDYPFYDIIQDEDGNHITLEIALAGWEKNDINITVEKDLLTISATKTKMVDDEQPIYLHKGISRKSFNKSFTMGADVEMGDVTFKNGILKIEMERVIPEKDQPRTIRIR
jgi:molecular chaperone IbpA